MAGEVIDVRYINAGRVRGLSTYELAVKHGVFTGTEQEFAEAQIIVDTKLQQIKERVDKLSDEFEQSLVNLEDSVSQSLVNILTSLDALQSQINDIKARIPENLSINITDDDVRFNITE